MQDTMARLAAFRQGLYQCFTRAADALFTRGDARGTDPSARSFVQLSQAPAFTRRWPSLSEALEDGQIDHVALRRLFGDTLPVPTVGTRVVVALDSSPLPRPSARVVADRTLVHVPAAGQVLPPHTAPVRPGWQMSVLVGVPDPPRSWTDILDTQRSASDATATTIGAAQLAAVVPLLPTRPCCLRDGGSGHARWVQATAAVGCDHLGRAAATRGLYRPAPPRTGKRGAPGKDGLRCTGSDPATQGPPEGQWAGVDAHGHAIALRSWSGRHRKTCRAIPLTVVCRPRAAAAGTGRDPPETWFWWLGGRPGPPLDELARLSPRRFAEEQGFRFDKQDLLWTAPPLKTPAQRERWTDVVSAVHHELRLARPLVEAHRLPGEDPTRPASPRQVRRGLARILWQVGTPARPARPRGKSPGRATGAVVRHAAPCPVIRKGHKRRPKRRQAA
jgi:DDE superfamily endonuclease